MSQPQGRSNNKRAQAVVEKFNSMKRENEQLRSALIEANKEVRSAQEESRGTAASMRGMAERLRTTLTEAATLRAELAAGKTSEPDKESDRGPVAHSALIVITETHQQTDAVAAKPAVEITETHQQTDAVAAKPAVEITETHQQTDAVAAKPAVEITETHQQTDAVATKPAVEITETHQQTDAVAAKPAVEITETHQQTDAVAAKPAVEITETHQQTDAVSVRPVVDVDVAGQQTEPIGTHRKIQTRRHKPAHASTNTERAKLGEAGVQVEIPSPVIDLLKTKLNDAVKAHEADTRRLDTIKTEYQAIIAAKNTEIQRQAGLVQQGADLDRTREDQLQGLRDHKARADERAAKLTAQLKRALANLEQMNKTVAELRATRVKLTERLDGIASVVAASLPSNPDLHFRLLAAKVDLAGLSAFPDGIAPVTGPTPVDAVDGADGSWVQVSTGMASGWVRATEVRGQCTIPEDRAVGLRARIQTLEADLVRAQRTLLGMTARTAHTVSTGSLTRASPPKTAESVTPKTQPESVELMNLVEIQRAEWQFERGQLVEQRDEARAEGAAMEKKMADLEALVADLKTELEASQKSIIPPPAPADESFADGTRSAMANELRERVAVLESELSTVRAESMRPAGSDQAEMQHVRAAVIAAFSQPDVNGVVDTLGGILQLTPAEIVRIKTGQGWGRRLKFW
ncbi:hypothetical protein J8273_0350 [Carpediemonas membranifera]|uniref:GRIP domain-containing protein n=1 Tax=Carpediemonas membranifera TaxID=201153 RepID=A0A8J6AUK9_9EUKA|nr:hypothetical protein J8273_0350 [Carpediemonas membranifera]|eukprot:KAG9395131.1 hypothetical protein J8273_0350 [Carpediemonas membranifera]